MARVIVAGSRTLSISPLDLDAIVSSSGLTVTELVSGCARGIDQCGEVWARLMGIPITQFPAAWESWGTAAGPRRNRQMAVYADALIVIWDGRSAGTQHMIRTMNKLGKPVHIYIRS